MERAVMTDTVTKRVLDKLDKIDENITDMKTKIASIETKLVEQPKLDDSRHDAIEEKFDHHDRRIGNLESNQKWVVLTILAIIIGAIITNVLK